MADMFEYENDEAARLHRELIQATDGTEPCYDPYLLEVHDERIYESNTDLYVENYANRGVTPTQAAKLCDGCHVIDECLAFALANEEKYGVWGGTTPRQRGWYRGKRIKE